MFDIFSPAGQDYNSLLAYPPDHWTLDWLAEYAKSETELWVGLDGRSVWSEENLEMDQRQWVISTGSVATPAEIKWNNSEPLNDTNLQCVYLHTPSR